MVPRWFHGGRFIAFYLFKSGPITGISGVSVLGVLKKTDLRPNQSSSLQVMLMSEPKIDSLAPGYYSRPSSTKYKTDM